MLRFARMCTSLAFNGTKRLNIIPETPWISPYKIRPLKYEEIPKLIDIKRTQGTHDVSSALYTWYRLDPEGISVALSETDQIIGVLGVLNISEEFYFACLFYIPHEYRKSGIGTELCKERYSAKRHRNIGLNATPELTDSFKKVAVAREDRFVMNIYETFSDVTPDRLSDHIPEDIEIQQFSNTLLLHMRAYDSELMGYKRKFLDWSCQENGSRTFVAFKNTAGSKECVGYGTIKESCIGTGRVGPLYADDPQVAEVLLKRLLMSMPNVRGFAMMGISSNNVTTSLMKKIGCPKTKHYKRLYTQKVLEVNPNKVYGVFDINAVPY